MIRPQPKPERRAPKARKPLRRTSQLRAKRWGIAWKRPRRLDGPGADPAYIEWLHERECVVPATVPGADPCEGRVQACHEGARETTDRGGRRSKSMNQKAPDQTAFTMCRHHHIDSFTVARGCFRGWTKEQRREWGEARGAESRAVYLSHGGRRA